MNMDWIQAGIGGILIGVSVSLMLLWNGRVTGISGIIYGLLKPEKGDVSWRWGFLMGLVFGGFTLMSLKSEIFERSVQTPSWTLAAAGLLVGFGTVLGSGCTSGHGVCGISRMSPRSIVATVLFISAGILSVVIFRNLGVYL